MNLPIQLIPTKTKPVPLPSGGTVKLPVCQPVFLRWNGKLPNFRFGKKPIVDDGGKPVFAELALLNLLRSSGWNGVWVSAFGGTHFLREMPSGWKLASHHVPIPKEKEDVLRRIRKAAGTKACFDVFAWKDADILFCEAKYGKDRLTKPECKFIEGALQCGVQSDSLLIAEWSFNEKT
jgi:hypothetical protein